MHYDLAILDLDGVVYIGPDAVPHAIPALRGLAARGTRLTAATNNANRPASEVAAHLRQLGLDIEDHEVMTSAQAAAAFLARAFAPGAPVLAVGGEGVSRALTEVGLRVLRASADLTVSDVVADEAVAVMMGYGPLVAWFDLACATWAIDRGKRWIATNTDPTVPQPYGRAPGNGAFVGMLQRTTGKVPEVIGKPQPALFEETMAKAGTRRALVIGDRLDTDIDGANAANIDSLLVCTGVQGPTDLALQAPSAWPTFVAQDLRSLEPDAQVVPLTCSNGWITAEATHPVVLAVVAAANAALGHEVSVPEALAVVEPSPLIDARVMRAC